MSTHNIFFPSLRPKILLINFTSAEAEQLKAKHWNVEMGWAAGVVHYYPSTPAEYDIVIAKFKEDDIATAQREMVNLVATTDVDDYSRLASRMTTHGFVITFTGETSIDSLRATGLPYLSLDELDNRDTVYTVSAEKGAVAITKPGLSFIKTLLNKFKESMSRPVKHGVRQNKLGEAHIAEPLAHNAENKPIGVMGFDEIKRFPDKAVAIRNSMVGIRPVLTLVGYTPKYIVLPAMEGVCVRVVTEILNQLQEWRPELFPKDNNYKWLEGDKYLPIGAAGIGKRLENERAKHESAVEALQTELNTLLEADKPTRQLLVADDSEEFLPADNLSSSVAAALRELGFIVEQKDTELRDGKRREDLVCSDTDFEALAECKGTVSSNPPESYVSQLLTHILSVKDRSVHTGMLIVNHDRKNDPTSRSLPYEDAKHLWENVDDRIIVPTVELYKIVRAVQNGELEKPQARLLIKRPGRFTYPPTHSSL